MTKLQYFFSDLTIWVELICALLGIFFYREQKKTYWIFFVYYVVIIFILEAISRWGLDSKPQIRKFYYDFFVIPIQFIFLFWLYSIKSLKKNLLFLSFLSLYLLSFLPHLFYLNYTRQLNSLSYTTGTFLLLILVFLEYIKQIKSDEIIYFRKNKMFYINAGILFFYLGTLPFFTFDKYLYENDRELWNNYLTFFLLSVNIMYLLFSASFIWGKPKT